MCFGYVIPDTTTHVGAVNNGKQAISIYDQLRGTRKTYITTPEKVDNYLKSKENITKSFRIGFLTTAGTAFGGAILAFSKLAKSVKIGGGIALAAATVLSWLPLVSANKTLENSENNIKNEKQ